MDILPIIIALSFFLFAITLQSVVLFKFLDSLLSNISIKVVHKTERQYDWNEAELQDAIEANRPDGEQTSEEEQNPGESSRLSEVDPRTSLKELVGE